MEEIAVVAGCVMMGCGPHSCAVKRTGKYEGRGSKGAESPCCKFEGVELYALRIENLALLLSITSEYQKDAWHVIEPRLHGG